VVFDVVYAVSQVSVPFTEVGDQEMPHETFSVLVEVAREPHLPFQDLLIDRHWVFVGEGVDPSEHLVDQYAGCPPVDRLSVALV
jgi:hypothetical protein